MTQTPGTPPFGIKVGLKRINLEERVFGDDELRRSPFVCAVGEEPMRQMLAQACGKRFADQARIFQQGEPGASLVFLLRGEARLSVGCGATSAELTSVRRGEVMGEREALGEGSERRFSAHAVGEVEVVEFPRELVSRFARSHPQLGEHLRQLSRTRCTAGAELADFLNRW